jgi:hypothetical protein
MQYRGMRITSTGNRGRIAVRIGGI